MNIAAQYTSAESRLSDQLDRLRALFGADHQFDTLADLAKVPVTRRFFNLPDPFTNPALQVPTPGAWAIFCAHLGLVLMTLC